jgi:hypothetical protein
MRVTGEWHERLSRLAHPCSQVPSLMGINRSRQIDQTLARARAPITNTRLVSQLQPLIVPHLACGLTR